jgi:hypothetical protein
MDCEVIDVWYCFSAEAAEARGCIDLQEQFRPEPRDKTKFGFLTNIFPL